MADAGAALLARLVPRRRRGVELLDDPAADSALALRSLRDVSYANRLFGGTSAVLSSLRPHLRQGAALTLLDVGTGAGDIPARARALAARSGASLETFGVERTLAVAAGARALARSVCVADGFALPFQDRSIDIVACSQVLHHFEDQQALLLLRELDRVARRLVIIADLRRSWPAAGGIWAASFLLRFHPVSRHDGVLSVLRGYRGNELASLVERAVGTVPIVRNRWGFRLTACWSPS